MFENIKAVAFDLDGTIYVGDSLVPGASELTGYLKNKGIDVFYFTNNSTKTRNQIFEKLQKLGLSVEINVVYSSAYAAGLYLKEKGYSAVYCCGSKGLRNEIEANGTECVNDGSKKIQAVVVGLDNTFDYQKMTNGLNLLRGDDCKFIVCNKDRTYPVEGGVLMPGCGPIVAALENASGRTPDVIIGKPETYMLELLCRDWKMEPKQVLVVGDTYDSDIAMAKKAGAEAVFITGNDGRDDVISITSISGLKAII
ncbi:MAG: HAD family hydrolase [Candidatus Goldiibacteriota bacterium HGW-Goldbacteria-1]|jgi:phosphoglycolate/pyridoxal phosphate phosphatase family enzyme|nr:MAG: HAD family hydrolase [Candidatus Goldiibacteriota bacterium HGW-Goldbacteria-1]